jgi:hypothetical protein
MQDARRIKPDEPVTLKPGQAFMYNNKDWLHTAEYNPPYSKKLGIVSGMIDWVKYTNIIGT